MIDIRTLAANAVAKGFGATNAPQTLAIRRAAAGAYDPVTGTSTSTTTDYACTGIITGYGQHEVDGTSILTTDRKVIVPQSTLSIPPTRPSSAGRPRPSCMWARMPWAQHGFSR